MPTKPPSNRFSGPFLPFPRWLLDYLSGDGTTVMVMIGMLRYMNSNSQALTVSYDYLSKDLGISKSTVIRSVSKLVELGAVVKSHRSVNGHSLTNQFRINFNSPVAFEIPRGVTHDNPKGVSPMTLGGVTHDTPRGSTHDTQTRITNKNKEDKREPEEKSRTKMSRVDPRLLS